MLACATQDDHAHAETIAETGEVGLQFLRHDRVDRIEAVRTGEREPLDAVAVGDLEPVEGGPGRVVGHANPVKH